MSVDGIPKSVLDNFPAGIPPAGVEPNFINPPSYDVDLIVLNAVLLPLMWIVVSMRLYAKGRILRTMGWDDYTCLMAALGCTAHTAMEVNALHLGLGKHIWDIRASVLLDISNVRLLSATAFIYPFVIYFVKASILLLYLRIFGVDTVVRFSCHFALVFFTLFYIAYVGVQGGFLAKCVSSTALEDGLCKNLYALTVFQSAFNVASDVFVFALPIHRIMQLQVTKRQKLGLLAIFLAGLVACGVSIARLVITVATLNRADKFWYSAINATLTVVEMNIAIIAACMSTLPGVLVNLQKYGSSVFKSLRSRIFSSRSISTSTGFKKGVVEPEYNSSTAFEPSDNQKILGNTRYIQLEEGANGRPIGRDSRDSENIST